MVPKPDSACIKPIFTHLHVEIFFDMERNVKGDSGKIHHLRREEQSPRIPVNMVLLLAYYDVGLRAKGRNFQRLESPNVEIWILPLKLSRVRCIRPKHLQNIAICWRAARTTFLRGTGTRGEIAKQIDSRWEKCEKKMKMGCDAHLLERFRARDFLHD